MDWTYESDKRISIKFFDEGELKELTSNDIVAGSFLLTERLCSLEQIEFGSCEASVVRFTVGNPYVRLKGKEISVAIYNADNPDQKFSIGTYKVVSDKAVENRTKREIVAYDDLYRLSQVDVSDWYNGSAFNGGDSILIGLFVQSFFRHIAVPFTTPTTFPFLNVYKQPRELHGLMATDVMRAIGEVCGGTFRVEHNGTSYKFIPYTPTRIFAIPTKDIINFEYEEFTVKPVTQVVLQNSVGGAKYTYGTGDNVYTISNNLLFTEEGLKNTGAYWVENIYNAVKRISYVPFSAEVVGNLEMQLGDGVGFTLSDDTYVTSMILERTLNGIQGMTDSLIARGQEDREYDTGIAGQVSNISKRTAEIENEISDIVQGKLHAEENLELSADDAVVIKGNDGIYLESNVYTNKEFIDFENDVFFAEDVEISGNLKADSISPYSSPYKNTRLTLDESETELSNTDGSLRLNGEGGVEINSDSGVVKVVAGNDNLFLEGDSGVRIRGNLDTIEMDADGGVLANGYEVGREIETIELKMLGWNVPRECPIQNKKVYPNKFRKQVGRVAFEDMGWIYTSYNGNLLFNADLPTPSVNATMNLYCSDNRYVANSKDGWATLPEKNMRCFGSGIRIKDSRYTTVTDFVNANKGTYIYYELATPIETEIDGNEVSELPYLHAYTKNLSKSYAQCTDAEIEAALEEFTAYKYLGNGVVRLVGTGGTAGSYFFDNVGKYVMFLELSYYKFTFRRLRYANGTWYIYQ